MTVYDIDPLRSLHLSSSIALSIFIYLAIPVRGGQYSTARSGTLQ